MGLGYLQTGPFLDHLAVIIKPILGLSRITLSCFKWSLVRNSVHSVDVQYVDIILNWKPAKYAAFTFALI